MDQIDQDLNAAETRCRAQGERLTPKRRQVLEQLLREGHARSAYELVDALNEQTGRRPPAMSVYRILAVLEKCGLVHKLDSTSKYVACKHITECGEHAGPQLLICDNCDNVYEIDLHATLKRSLKEHARAAGFEINNGKLELHGRCADCGARS